MYLTGPAAEAAACDAVLTPMVTGQIDWAVLDQLTTVWLTTHGHGHTASPPDDHPAGPQESQPDRPRDDHPEEAGRKTTRTGQRKTSRTPGRKTEADEPPDDRHPRADPAPARPARPGPGPGPSPRHRPRPGPRRGPRRR